MDDKQAQEYYQNQKNAGMGASRFKHGLGFSQGMGSSGGFAPAGGGGFQRGSESGSMTPQFSQSLVGAGGMFPMGGPPGLWPVNNNQWSAPQQFQQHGFLPPMPPIQQQQQLQQPPLHMHQPTVPQPPIIPQSQPTQFQSQWTQHKTADGRVYYHNQQTGESSWSHPHSPAPPVPINVKPIQGTQWSQVMCQDGRCYYYNQATNTTAWEEPTEVTQINRQIPIVQPVKQPQKKDVQNTAAEQQKINASEEQQSKNEEQDDNEKAREQFKEALRELGVNAFSLWSREMQKMQEDDRYLAIKSEDERRAIFEEFCRNAGQEKTKKDSEFQINVTKGFQELLEEIKKCNGIPPKEQQSDKSDGKSEDLPEEGEAVQEGDESVRSLLHSKSSLDDLEKHWGSDVRWQGCPQNVRERLFKEWILPYRSRPPPPPPPTSPTTTTTAAAQSFKELLISSNVNGSSSWSKMSKQLDKDARSQLINRDERKRIFRSYVKEMRSQEEEEAKRAKEKVDKERNLRERLEREKEEGIRRRNRAAAQDAQENFKTLLQEQVKDPMGQYKTYKSKFDKDLQGRAVGEHLTETQMQNLFEDHVKGIFNRATQVYRTFVQEQLESFKQAQNQDINKVAELRSFSQFCKSVNDAAELAGNLFVTKLSEDAKYTVWRDSVDDIKREERDKDRAKRGRDRENENLKRQRIK